jgi:hypothetical protein
LGTIYTNLYETFLLKAINMEPEKIPIAKQWLCKCISMATNHVTAAIDIPATVGGVLVAMLSVESVLGLYTGN